ncbi:MAG: hypothetical protein JRE45_16105 [Deltaproteobacteria bacterium]|nr:hypothetical protein [Deltaproteobacteria bacterium]MBW2191601.1 hypothetical protein [Deltaproteobacteria bacterium]MBW2381462.1 hypothetical protein [Deltaproteobacteria bacterium]MBW2551844.1 hypothetical protein [Deltaproteobacteria bacterium]MBW2629128.1 hypothetical protein [Deltaproteobacteria bacterium]
MRFAIALVLGGALALGGCDSDGGSGSAGSGGSGGSGGSAGSGGDGASPTIAMVAWEATAGCTGGQRSDVVVTVTATDPDTDAGNLIYSGSVGGCGGPINAAVSTISCPNVAPYPGTVMVSDPDGNDSTPVVFDVGICATSSCTTDPDTCS